ncbi:protein MAL2 [Latimeria chalumnae]
MSAISTPTPAPPPVSSPALAYSIPIVTLPTGVEIFRTSSGALICLELIFGGLVWILVAASHVPVPLMQGWVMFVSVTMFICSALYLSVYTLDIASQFIINWNFLDFAYHFVAFVFYFGASLLEAATTAGRYKLIPSTSNITVPTSVLAILDSREYSISVAATIFSFVVTACYCCSTILGLRRWKM